MQPTKYTPSKATGSGVAACFADTAPTCPSLSRLPIVGHPQEDTRAAAERSDAGLVSFKTTHTPEPQNLADSRIAGEIRQARYEKAQAERGIQAGSYRHAELSGKTLVLDPRVQRAARCRKALLNTARMLTKGMQATKHRHKVGFYTVTYAKPEDYQPGHIALLMNHIRNYLARRGVKMRGLRKLEMQKRGAVHYHFMLWLPKGITLPKPDKQGWWPHGSTKCEWLRNGYGYCAKYVSKTEQEMVPKGARLFSLFGLDDDMKIEIKWWAAPKFVRDAFPRAEGHKPIRARGGGWVSQTTGEVVHSEWQFGGINSVLVDGVPQYGWIRLIETPWAQKEKRDLKEVESLDSELRFFAAAADSLRNAQLRETDYVQWILNQESEAIDA